MFAGATDLAGTPLASISSLNYDTYRASVDAGNNLAIALSINVDYDLTDGVSPAATAWQGRIVYEPYQTVGGAVTQNQWQNWNTTLGKWWQSGNPVVGGITQGKACPQSTPCTWEQMKAVYPAIGVHATLGVLEPEGRQR